MLHTIAAALLLAGAALPAAPVAAEESIPIPFDLEADGTIPFVDTSAVESLPVAEAGQGRALLGVSTSGSKTTTNYDGDKAKYGYNPGPSSSVKHTRQSSSVKCTSYASSSAFSKSKNAHASAVAYAVKYGCSHKFSDKWFKKVRIAYQKRAGYAIAKAFAYASTQCESKGNAYGCAYAKAIARAWARAVFSANAYAYAKALNKCKHCYNKYNLAKAESYGYASEFTKVVADVEARAYSQTCVSGDASAGNSVYAKCVQKIYGVAFAKATAIAIINGRCGYYGSNLDAKAIAAARAVIDTWEYTYC